MDQELMNEYQEPAAADEKDATDEGAAAAEVLPAADEGGTADGYL